MLQNFKIYISSPISFFFLNGGERLEVFKLFPHFLIIRSIIILEVVRDIKHKILNIIFFHIIFHMQKDGSYFQVILKDIH